MLTLDDPQITYEAHQERVVEKLQEQNVHYAALNAAASSSSSSSSSAAAVEEKKQ